MAFEQFVAEQAAKETKGGTGAYTPVVDIVEEAIKEILALRKEMRIDRANSIEKRCNDLRDEWIR